jgi:hypothetical protein
MGIEYNIRKEETEEEARNLDGEEMLPAVTLLNEEGELEPRRVLLGKYRDVLEVEIFFQKRKIARELRKLRYLEKMYKKELEEKEKRKAPLNKKAVESINKNK